MNDTRKNASAVFVSDAFAVLGDSVLVSVLATLCPLGVAVYVGEDGVERCVLLLERHDLVGEWA
jgi:hypothetical protein